ncbi:hypothetical protein [Lewinella cohaerens]|uniref:hypothetical protein n=1 Tax=Lewinella cohaerens TaxID=70995 RepID=UPI0003A4C531|nr:hypothetical protein [Lewinella cohaerens]
MSRNQEDLCLLCKANKATKTNSHIIPKFMSSSFLGGKSNKKGFIISSTKEGKITIQDSPKEDYILCPECEEYFSVLEGLVADSIKSIHPNDQNAPVPEVGAVTLINIPPVLTHLFFYSIFWRASISGLPVFQNYNFSGELEEALRVELEKFRATSRQELNEKLQDNFLTSFFPYGVFTTNQFSDDTKNLIIAIGTSPMYSFVADKFAFVIYDDLAQIPADRQILFNISPGEQNIQIIPPSVWEDVIIKNNLALVADIRKQINTQKEKLQTLAKTLSELSPQESKELRTLLEEKYDV